MNQQTEKELEGKIDQKFDIQLEEENKNDEEIDTQDNESYQQQQNLRNQNSEQSSYTPQKPLHKNQQQFKALFFKSMALQSKQIGTNICQILTPLICLVFVFLIKNLAQSQTGTSFSLPFPFIFNVPGLYNAYPFIQIDCLEWYMFDVDELASKDTKDYVGQNTGKDGQPPSGLLSKIEANQKCKYQATPDSDIQERTVPFFQNPPEGKTINESLFDTLTELNTMPFKRGLDIEGSAYLPDGAVRFYEASDEALRYSVQINDVRMKEYHRNNGITKMRYENVEADRFETQIRVAEGMLSLIDLINRSYMRNINENVWIVSGIQYMPLVGEDTGFILRIISVTGASLYPLALSLLLPIFMYTIVLEKEEKLLEMMKMNGMNMKDYWLITFLFYMLITFLTFSIFYLFGYLVLDLDFFTETGPSLLICTFVGWGITQISMSFFFQVFLGKARSATIIGYLLSIWTSLISVTFNIAVYPAPYELPFGLRMYPPFAFSRLIYDISIACSDGACYQDLSQMSQEMDDCMIFLYVSGIIFLVLGIYLQEIVPQEYGTQKHPLFFLDMCRNCKKKNKQQQLQHQQLNEENEQSMIADPSRYEGLEEDQDSKNIREFVHNLKESYSNYPLIIKDLRKQYKQVGGRDSHVAVKCLSLVIEPGEIFGLLGPNGSGKTTTISMITGMFPPTEGNAWIAGFDIINQMDQVHLNIGVCPQFDLLWPELTIYEHLMFYSRLKGIPTHQQKVKVEKAIKEVYLTKFTNYRVRELSGGMKRRLSVAISLVGDPKIIFLDEPSTGLDPENRRQLWDILSECRGKRAMVLTTHSMEEADVLCTKIGIITDGILRCIGPQVRLKSLYGGGYHLYINCHKDKYLEKKEEKENSGQDNDLNIRKISNDSMGEKHDAKFFQEQVKEFIEKLLPSAKLITSFNGNLIYQVPMEGLKVSKLFEELEGNKEQLRISDWGISQSSLEDVFMKIVDDTCVQED